MKEAFAKWKLEHPTAYKRTLLVLIGLVLGLVGGAVFYAKTARAAPAVLDCANGAAWQWNPATSTLTCTPSATTPPPVVTPPLPGPDPNPPSGCPAGSLVITGQWGNTQIKTSDFGDFGGNIMAVEVKVPAAGFSGSKTSSWGEYASGPTARYAVLSTKACDFSVANILPNGYGQKLTRTGNGVSVSYKIGASRGFTVGLTAGTTYYWNMKNTLADGVTPTCTISNCSMQGGLPQ